MNRSSEYDVIRCVLRVVRRVKDRSVVKSQNVGPDEDLAEGGVTEMGKLFVQKRGN